MAHFLQMAGLHGSATATETGTSSTRGSTKSETDKRLVEACNQAAMSLSSSNWIAKEYFEQVITRETAVLDVSAPQLLQILKGIHSQL